MPFFKKLRKTDTFEWTMECEVTFEQLKDFLSSEQILSRPFPGEQVLIYLSVLDQAISSVLIREKGLAQKPIYYFSEVLQGAELNYVPIEKLAYALLLSARKYKVYLQAHQAVVITYQTTLKIPPQTRDFGQNVMLVH